MAGSAISWQAVQQAGVKVIYLGRILVLARLLVPEDFGLLAIAAISVEVLMHLTEIGMIPALVQRVDVQNRHYNAAWTVGMLRALAVSSVVFLGARHRRVRRTQLVTQRILTAKDHIASCCRLTTRQKGRRWRRRGR